MSKQPDRADAGPWLAVWARIADAADELRRCRARERAIREESRGQEPAV